MLLLKEITTHSPFYKEAEELLIKSFPEEERRPIEQQRLYTDTHRQFQAQAILSDFAFAGIMNIWHLTGATYIEHLAIVPELRRNGIASEALKTLQRRSNKPIILEVEPAIDETTISRINFYERNGFKLQPISYTQPPYSQELPPVSLNIMTYGDTPNIGDIIEEIKSTVYGTMLN
ncbi:MAG: GNAT family N-acetyltransferase [Bacteroidales bacterium]|nr:GNAT family N-acetyltransferase [Bacteroidales bacterium]